jgi:hypothetical protein
LEEYLTREPGSWDFPAPLEEEETQATEAQEEVTAPEEPALVPSVAAQRVVDDFHEFTFEDYMDTDEPMKLLVRIPSPYQRQRMLTRMDAHAKSLGYKSVKKDWAAYSREQKSLKERSDDNLIEDIPAKYGLNLECGAYISDQDGVRCYKGETELVVCAHPIFPIERYEDIESGEQKLRIAFRNGSRWRTAVVAKTALFSGENVKALASVGAAVTQENSRLLAKYLAEVEARNHDRIPEQFTTRHMGYFEGYGFVPYISNLIFDGDSVYAPLFDSVTSKGDFNQWREHVAQVWNFSVEARIAIAASFASPLLNILHVQPFFVHLNSGQSGTGKTVALMVAASVWGNPARFIQTFNGTKASMEYTAGFLNHLPLILDELQLAKDATGKLRFSVYDLTEGIGRGRAQKTGGIRRTERWQNVFITSGESELVTAADGAGAFNRVLNIEFLDSIVENGAHTAEFVRKNYGHAGKLFVEKLLHDEEIAAELPEFYQNMLEDFTGTHNGKRISGKQANAAAALYVAAWFARMVIWPPAEGWQLEELKVEQLLDVLQDEAEISVGKRAYDFILDWIGTNVNSFVDEHRCGQNGEYQVRRLDDVKGKLFGKIRTDDVTLIIKSVFEAALMDNGYSPAPVYKWLRANGKLKAKDAVSAVYSIGGTKVRCVGIFTGSQGSQG